MKHKISKLTYTIIYSVCSIGSLFAQEDFPDNTDDITPAAPINTYVNLTILITLYIAYKFLKPKQTNKSI